MTKKSPKPFWALALLILVGMAVHLLALTKFPIFADEAIYIRWAQLIMDDAKQYAFFSLNDGKTPLFIWLLVPFQYLFANQLFAARLVSVLVGGLQAVAMAGLIRALGGRQKTQLLGAAFTLFLPIWFLYQHLALMDSLLAACLTFALWGAVSLVHASEKKGVFSPRVITLMLATGVAYGAAFWTKLPALLFLPSLAAMTLLPTKMTLLERVRRNVPLMGAVLLGLVIFVLLRISPAFGQLFRRSQDFTVSGHVLSGESWSRWMTSLRIIFQSLYAYISLPVFLVALSGLFFDRTRRRVAVLLLASLSFVLPFILFGKVVHARYFLPAAIGVTASAALTAEAMYGIWIYKAKDLRTRSAASIGAVCVISLVLSQSYPMVYDLLLSPNETPFIPTDREEYLEEWSSGHGLAETTELIRELSAKETIAVATEGRFGSLPDGLLVYFHGQDVSNIYIEGTGQYPVKSIPPEFAVRAKKFDRSLLVVNSHRMEIRLPESAKIAEFCRPHNAPCLQVWDVTELVQQTPTN